MGREHERHVPGAVPRRGDHAHAAGERELVTVRERRRVGHRRVGAEPGWRGQPVEHPCEAGGRVAVGLRREAPHGRQVAGTDADVAGAAGPSQPGQPSRVVGVAVGEQHAGHVGELEPEVRERALEARRGEPGVDEGHALLAPQDPDVDARLHGELVDAVRKLDRAAAHLSGSDRGGTHVRPPRSGPVRRA